MSSLNLFQLALRGVNTVTAPTHLTSDEVTAAQNAETSSIRGEGGIDQRPGMTPINSVALDGAIVGIADIPADRLADKTPTLYAAMYSTATHKWRKTTDGTTWTNVDTPLSAFSDTGAVAGYFKNYSKAVTINGKLYYPSGTTGAIDLHQWDGVNDVVMSTIPPAISGTVLTRPAAPSLIAEGYNTPGVTSYTYKAVAKSGTANSVVSNAEVVTNGAATLNTTTDYVGIDLGIPVAGATAYDVYRTAGGATQGKIGTVPVVSGNFTFGNGSGLSGGRIAAPGTAPTDPHGIGAGLNGAAGATTYTYRLVAITPGGHSAQSAVITVTGVPATLGAPPSSSSIAFVQSGVAPFTAPPAGATRLDVYRTAGHTSTGLIGTITISGGAYTTGNGSDPTASYLFSDWGLAGNGASPPATGSGFDGSFSWHLSDGGLVGDGSTAPAVAAGTSAGNSQVPLDVITDGQSVFVATLDLAAAEPTMYGRVLQFSPLSKLWLQQGPSFPLAAGNGTGSALAFYDGALSYGTYTGVATGNTSYLKNLGVPLPAGGVQETHTTSASQETTAIAAFNGTLYVGYTHLAATAALLVKRVAGATWSTSLTAPASSANNGWTCLIVFNGMLFAGWNSGGGATAAKVYSTVDGTNWTLELTTAVAQVPMQATIFNGALYMVMSGRQHTQDSHIYQRTAAGTWTLVDTTTDALGGAIGVVYI